MLISKKKKKKRTKSRNLLQMCIFCLLSFYKKGGKIQIGLNCEYNGLSEVMLSLSNSRFHFIWHYRKLCRIPIQIPISSNFYGLRRISELPTYYIS